MTRSRRALLLTAIMALLAFLPATRPTAAASRTFVGPKQYYLALGDSAAFSFQISLQFFKGYTDDFYNGDLKYRGVTHFINMGCGGESSSTMINGNCGGRWILKYPYTGPQLTAALNFIKQHPGEVSPVTFDMGANDVIGQINPTNCTISSSFTQTLTTMDTNMQSILSQLQTALNGTGDIFGMNYWYPYQNQCPATVPYAQQFDSHLAADYAMFNIPMADIFSAFGGPATPNQELCMDTWICGPFHDIHPTTRGYAIIAQRIEALAGY